MTKIGRRRPTGLVGGVLAIVAMSVLVFAASQAVGREASHATTNDGGAWLLNRSVGSIGHVNREVGELTGRVRVGDPGAVFNVDQADGIVLVHDQQANLVRLVNDQAFTTYHDIVVPEDLQVFAVDHGLVLARSDPTAIWRGSVTEIADLEAIEDLGPAVSVEGASTTTLTVAGSTITVMSETGEALRVDSDGEVDRSEGRAPVEIAQLAAVGEKGVALDESEHLLVVDDGVRELSTSIDLSGAVLQQSSPAWSDVVVATRTGDVFRIDLTDGTPTQVGTAEAGETDPAAVMGIPADLIFHHGCAFVLRTEPAGLSRSCGDKPDRHWPVTGTALQLRLVNGWIWVNDVDNGIVHVLDESSDDLERIDDWGQVLGQDDEDVDEDKEIEGGDERLTVDPNNPDAELRTADEIDEDGINQPPIAEDDEASTQTERPVLINVLGNDSDPDGDVLAVVAIENLTTEAGQVWVTADRTQVQFTPAVGYVGTARLNYTISDGRGERDTAEVVIDVHPSDGDTNEPPIAVRDHIATQAGSTAVLDVLGNDTDPDGDALVLVDVQGEGGSISFLPSGEVTFTPDASGTSSRIELTYTIADDFGERSDGTIIVDIRLEDANQKPDARHDRAVAVAGRPVLLNVLDNDTDPDNDPLLASSLQVITPLSPAVNATLANDGELIFEAPSAGTWVMRYTAADGAGSDTALIRIDVEGEVPNRPPVPARDDVVIPEGGTKLVYALENDGDPDGDVIGIVDHQPVDGLEIKEIAGIGFEVTVQPGAPSRPSFRYSISDGYSDPVGSVVVVSVAPVEVVDQPPVVRSDVVEVRAGVSTPLEVLANDHDPEGGPLTIISASTGSTGDVGIELSIDPTKQHVQIKVPLDARSDFVFGYDVEDQAGNRNAANVQVRVIDPTEQNRPPVARPDIQTTQAGREVVIQVLDNDTDPDHDSVVIQSITSAPSAGTAEKFEGGIRYVPDAGFTGTDRFTYSIVDTLGAQDVGEVLVGVMPVIENRPPNAIDDQLSLVAGAEEIAITVLDNDSDPDGDDDLRVVEVTDVSGGHGSVRSADDGKQVFYTPPPQHEGEDLEIAFGYTIDDGRGLTDSAVVNVVIVSNIAPLPPQAFADQFGPFPAGEVVTLAVLDNDLDPDGDPAALTISVADPALTVTPDRQLSLTTGTETRQFEYTITDAQDLTSTATVTVLVVENQAPTVEPLTAETTFQTEISFDLGAQVSDPDESDQVFFVCCQDSRGGRAEVGQSGADQLSVTFRPDDGFTGTAGFGYTADDQNGHQVAGSVSITVLPAENVAPEATPNPPDVTVEAGRLANVDLRAYVTDPDVGDTLTFEVVESNAGGIIVARQGADAISITAADDATGGSTDITVTARDSEGETATATFTVTVAPTTSPLPTANLDRATTNQEQPVTLRVLDNDIGTGLELVSTNGSAGGTTAVGGDGRSIVFTPTTGTFGPTNATYVIVDKFHNEAQPREVTGQIEISVIGRPAKPAAPAGTADSKQVSLTWTAPANNGAPISKYRIEHDRGGTQELNAVNSYVWTGLTNGDAYRFRIQAENIAGVSEWSEFSAEQLPNAIPGRPAAPTVTFDDRQLKLVWIEPQNEGSAIAGYDIELGGAGSAVQDVGTVTAYTWPSLTNGETYQFRIRAKNKAGNGEFSTWTQGDHPFREPDAPPAITATRGSRVISLAWQQPVNNGDPVTDYEIEMKSAAGTFVKVPAGQLTYDWANLTNGVEQEFRVRALNQDPDPGAWSGYSNPVKPCDVPDAPDAPTATRGDLQAAVSWTAPGTQGCAISGYEIETAGQTQSAAAGATTHTFTGLTNGTSYTFKVRAINEEGAGARSPASGAVVPAGPPKQTTGVAAAPGDRQITVTWNAADGNGRPVTRYEAQVNNGAVVSVGTGTSHTFTGLGVQTAYSVRIRAVNEIGPSATWSNAANATTWGPPAAPGPPALSAPPYGQIAASWGAPASDRPITRYHVEVQGVTTFNAGTARSHTFSGLANGSTYRVRVQACSSVGCGAWSSFAQITTPTPPAVSIRKGDSAVGRKDCSSEYCAHIDIVSHSGIPTNSTVYCYGRPGGEGGNGFFVPGITLSAYGGTNRCYWGFGPGTVVYVIVNGVKSNEVTW